MRSDADASRLVRAWPWLFAAFGFALDLAAFWPGQMSFDSALAWSQARHGDANGIVPLVFVLAWRATNVFVTGPGGLFALHLALFWSGLAWLAQALRWRPLRGAIALACIAFLPASWLLRAHVWTDVGVIAAAICALGLLARAQVATRRDAWLGAALPCLAYAALLRHNALPAIVPMLAWWSALAWRLDSVTWKRRAAVVATTCIAALAIFGIVRALDASLRERIPVWPSLAQFDLAGMSIETRQMLLPGFMIGPGLDVDELAAAFRPWSNLTLFNTHHGMRSPFEPFAPNEFDVLRDAWLDAIAHRPGAWLLHRWHVTRALFGTHTREWPAELIYVDAQTSYGDNPPIAANGSTLHARLVHAANALRATPALAAWPYLLAGLFAASFAWRRRRDMARRIALAALASAWLLALPLCALAPSAELRYLGWPCVASLLAIAVAFTPRADKLETETSQGTP